MRNKDIFNLDLERLLYFSGDFIIPDFLSIHDPHFILRSPGSRLWSQERNQKMPSDSKILTISLVLLFNAMLVVLATGIMLVLAWSSVSGKLPDQLRFGRIRLLLI